MATALGPPPSSFPSIIDFRSVSAKIRTLGEFHTRILTNQQPPSNAEIVTTLRYFQQTLIGFLKDVSSENARLFERFNAESARSSLFPNLNYKGLFNGIANLLEAFSFLASGQTAIGEAILDVLKALYFFVDRDAIDQYPFLIASQLGVLPSELDSKLVRLLTECVVPYSLSEHASGDWSIPAVLMLIFQQCSDTSLHTLAVESFMACKLDVYEDLLAVIAKGTSESRIAATNLLFHYWPLLDANILHRKPVQYRVQAWSPAQCQNFTCLDKGPAIKRTYDPVACAKYGETAPPMLVCRSCVESGEVESREPTQFLCQPMPSSMGVACQNRVCESASRMMFGTCFAEDCIRSHSHVPLRLCAECYDALHPADYAGSPLHMRHSQMGVIWDRSALLQGDMTEAVVKLLKETSSVQIDGSEAEGKRPKWLRQLEAGHDLGKDIDSMSDERRMLSRYGIWLMSALCPPDERIDEESLPHLGYIVSMVFQWFMTTSLLPNDSFGAAIEQLKTDFASNWLQSALTHHYDTVVEMLMPDLPEYGKVGGIWEKYHQRKDQLKEGLQKLLAVIPYDVISFETWNRVMPEWLHAISQELPDDEDLADLKVLMCKIFEPDLCPLPFQQAKMFEFVAVRLTSGVYHQVIRALDWLHLLSRIDIRIDIGLLLDMFRDGLNSIRSSSSPTTPKSAAAEGKDSSDVELELASGPLAVEVIMVDVIAQQMKLNNAPVAGGDESSELVEKLFSTAAVMLQYQVDRRQHSCRSQQAGIGGGVRSQQAQSSECLSCQQAVFLYQVLSNLVGQCSPADEATIEVEDISDLSEWLAETQLEATSESVTLQSHAQSPREPPFISPQFPTSLLAPNKGAVPPSPLLCQTAEMKSPSLSEFVGMLPSEEMEAQTATQSTLMTEGDIDHEACHQAVAATTLYESAKQVPLLAVQGGSGEGERKAEAELLPPPRREFWDTSVGRFRFTIEQLPPHLRLLYSLLTENDPDVQYSLLLSLKYLCLHAEALSSARREQRGFLIWVQENYMVPKLWALLRPDYLQVGQLAAHLLIHAITLPCGEDVFWGTVNAQFTNQKWEARFKAERVYVLSSMIIDPARQVDPMKGNKLLQMALSCAFCHLIVSIHDPNAAVAQKAILALKSVPSTSLTLICQCLEAQFDSCILDRPLIINRLQLLSTVLPEENLLSWDFFIQRFETLALEAQLRYHSSESGFVQDLLHSDPMSELYQRKVTRARQSINEAESVRSIVRSLRESSLKHQLTVNSKTDKEHLEQRRQAQRTMKARGRRGATCGADLARLRMRKVLMMVRCVNAFRTLAARLPALRSPFRSSGSNSRSASPTVTIALEPLVALQQEYAPLGTAVSSLMLQQCAFAVGESASIAMASEVGTTTGAVNYDDEGELHARGGGSRLLSDPCSIGFSNDGLSSGGGGGGGGERGGVATSPAEKSGEGYSRLREFTDEESNLCLLLNRVVDIEVAWGMGVKLMQFVEFYIEAFQNPERHTVYLTVSLFVHFLSNKRCGATDEKANAKKQSVLLRHFNTLLGYSNSERCFTIPPHRLRRSAVCNAFLCGLPEILDANLMIGNQMLPIILQLLIHLPSPQKFASDQSSADYSLELMRQKARHSWLRALTIILYKYRCEGTTPIGDGVRKLMLIVVATMEAECHVCRAGATSDDVNNNNSESAGERGRLLEWVQWSDDESPTEGDGVVEEEGGEGGATASPSRADRLKPGVTPPTKLKSPARRRLRLPGAKGRTATMRAAAGSGGRRRPLLRATACALRCVWCDEPLQSFDEETISLCLITMSTHLQREPAMAAPLLPRMIHSVVRFIDTPHFPWHSPPAAMSQSSSGGGSGGGGGAGGSGSVVFVPGNSKSAAKQFLRVALHQLSGSGVALQLFDLPIGGASLHTFWSSISFALADFSELSSVQLIQCLLDDVLEEWPVATLRGVERLLHNLAVYITHVSLLEHGSAWGAVTTSLEAFFRRYHSQLAAQVPGAAGAGSTGGVGAKLPTTLSSSSTTSNLLAANTGGAQQSGGTGTTAGGTQLIRSEFKSSVVIVTHLLRVHNFSSLKSAVALMESYAKWLVEVLRVHKVELRDLLEVCSVCNRVMLRERDKLIVTRAVVAELIQAFKFKCELFDENSLTIVNLILQDFGEEPRTDSGGGSGTRDGMTGINELAVDQFNTGASEAIRPFMSEILDFIADLHVLSKLKKQTSSDRMGGDLKAIMSEVLALEMSRPSTRDSRTVMRFIPWLYTPPSLTQAAPGTFADSVTNVRLLTWILLGALHASRASCLPVPINCSTHVADYIVFVLAGFAEQSKQSVVHMSALFHAFHLCQLWTVYCEQSASRVDESVSGLQRTKIMEHVMEFWARVTPAILQLLSHSRVLADMVNLHFVTTMQALQQRNSPTLCLLYPMWQPILTVHHAVIPSQLRAQLDECENQPPIRPQPLELWLRRVRYKISQIELQTSAASPFYNV